MDGDGRRWTECLPKAWQLLWRCKKGVYVQLLSCFWHWYTHSNESKLFWQPRGPKNTLTAGCCCLARAVQSWSLRILLGSKLSPPFIESNDNLASSCNCEMVQTTPRETTSQQARDSHDIELTTKTKTQHEATNPYWSLVQVESSGCMCQV